MNHSETESESPVDRLLRCLGAVSSGKRNGENDKNNGSFKYKDNTGSVDSDILEICWTEKKENPDNKPIGNQTVGYIDVATKSIIDKY